MNNRNDVEVLIDGRRYTICGFESDEYLQKVASYINQKFGEFKKIDNYRSMDLELRNVLLAINIADDYFKAEDKAAIYHSERELKDRMILEMKHEMIELQDAAKEHDKKVAELEKALEEAKKKNIELETRLKTKG